MTSHGTPSEGRKSLKRVASGVLGLCGLVFAVFSGWVYWANQLSDSQTPANSRNGVSLRADLADPKLIARGAYLAKVGNCAGCHSASGQAAYAGGRGLETPFGTTYAGNITADDKTGLGTWTTDDFWQALHHGRSKDGRLLNPVFPYSSYTLVSREDSDALFAFLRSNPSASKLNRPQELRFPFNSPIALALWRAFYFRPTMFQSRPEKSVDWNRGAYLVQGLGHCGACHSPRSVLGGVQSAPVHPQSLAGGVMPVQNWYAPSLRRASEAGLQSMSVDEATVLLKHGRNQQASVIGPMADVVFQSTQYLSDTDLVAMVAYLKDLPAAEATSKGTLAPNSALSNVADRTERLDRASQQPGQKLYEMHCADCHGEAGQGAQAEGVLAYPRLAGNRAVTMSSPLNLVRIVVQGGFPPATAGNPKPYGMPPFSHTLNDSQIAEVLTYIRQAWGNDAAAVYSLDVVRSR